MKLEIEIYDLRQQLVTIKDNKIVSFYPQAFRITSTDNMSFGKDWLDTNGTGPAFTIEYSEDMVLPVDDEYLNDQRIWVKHEHLYLNKKALIRALEESKEPDI